MKTFETTTTVAADGEIRVANVPFSPGTEVDIVIAPRRASAEEFAAAWKSLCEELRRASGADGLSDEVIAAEVDAYRASR